MSHWLTCGLMRPTRFISDEDPDEMKIISDPYNIRTLVSLSLFPANKLARFVKRALPDVIRGDDDLKVTKLLISLSQERNRRSVMAECESPDYKLVPYRGFNLIRGIHSPKEVDQIKNWEIRDSDIFVVTYPKSGTIWLQQILSLIEVKGDVTATKDQLTSQRIPWIELIGSEKEFISASSPRIRVTHLQYKFMPLELKKKKGKVIYVARNPKDVLVSYFHFHKYATMLETPKDFDAFFEKFMEGNVYGNCWFEHIKTWYGHKEEMNFLYITYEDMIKDLWSVVKRISLFLGKNLTPQQLNNVVEHSTFKNMKNNPQANYQLVPSSLLNHQEGSFLRKGIVGDWKNYFTVAQNERFDRVYQQEMKDVPLSFIWDMSDLITP